VILDNGRQRTSTIKNLDGCPRSRVYDCWFWFWSRRRGFSAVLFTSHCDYMDLNKKMMVAFVDLQSCRVFITLSHLSKLGIQQWAPYNSSPMILNHVPSILGPAIGVLLKTEFIVRTPGCATMSIVSGIVQFPKPMSCTWQVWWWVWLSITIWLSRQPQGKLMFFSLTVPDERTKKSQNNIAI